MAIDRQKLPGAGHSAQLDAAAVLEVGARDDDQVTHGARDQDFAGVTPNRHAGTDADGGPRSSLRPPPHGLTKPGDAMTRADLH
jgi:hypothetical protein